MTNAVFLKVLVPTMIVAVAIGAGNTPLGPGPRSEMI
jgi:hypothetical protein